MKGVISKVSEKEGAKNGKAWKKYGFQVHGDDRWFGFFEGNGTIKPEEDMSIEFEAVQNGKYWNANNITIVHGETPARKEVVKGGGKFDTTTMFIAWAKDYFLKWMELYPTSAPINHVENIHEIVDLGIDMKRYADAYDTDDEPIKEPF